MTFPTFPSPFTTRLILYLLQIAVTSTMGIQATYIDDSRSALLQWHQTRCNPNLCLQWLFSCIQLMKNGVFLSSLLSYV